MSTIAHPSFLISYLERLGKRPNRALSQNFLVDRNVVLRFLDLAQISPQDTVLEIGPGPGAFADEIVRLGANYIAIEKDVSFAADLRERYKNSPNALILTDDILTCDLESILPNSPVKIISNLPFQLTSPILDRLLPLKRSVSSCTFIMQKELADRLKAQPKTKAFSSLTVFTRLFATIGDSFVISSNCYFPKPGVETAAIHLELTEPAFDRPKELISFAKEGFKQRRKMLTSTLPYTRELVQKSLFEVGANEKARAEELSLDQWIKLFGLLENSEKTQS